nr:hypothetical protein [Oscillospiraceae bacterium]
MSFAEQVFARAVQMTDEAEERQLDLLRVLCSAAASSLASRLKDGLTPEDCREDFILAASLYALADLGAVAETVQVEEFKAGDLTVKQGSSQNRDAVSRCLQKQAELLMIPYLKDRFTFVGV